MGARLRRAVVCCVLASAAPAAAQVIRTDDTRVMEAAATRAIDARDWATATTQLQAAFAMAPHRTELACRAADVYAAAGEPVRAVTLLQAALRAQPTDVELQFALAKHQLATPAAETGLAALQTLVATRPSHYEAQLLVADQLFARSNWLGAAAAYQAYLTHRPRARYADDTRYTLRLAEALLQGGELRRAHTLFAGLARVSPDSMRARLGEAWAVAAMDCARAEPLLQAVVQEFPYLLETTIVQGHCELQTNNATAALARARSVIEMLAQPNATSADVTSREGTMKSIASLKAAAHSLAAEAFAKMGNANAADRSFALATTIEPNNPAWPLARARVLRQQGRVAEAEAALIEARSQVPPLAWWHEWARLQLQQREFARVQHALSPLVAQPPFVTLERWVGEAMIGAGTPQDAIVPLRRALARDGNRKTAEWLAYALTQAGIQALRNQEPDAARAAFAESHALWPTALSERNLALVAMGEARVALALRAPTTNATTLHVRARVLDAAGELAAADASFRQAAAVAKGEEAVRIALDRASTQLRRGNPVMAVELLTAIAREVAPSAQAAHSAALTTARHAAALTALETGDIAEAHQHMQAIRTSASRDVLCDAAWIAMLAKKPGAVERLRTELAKGCMLEPSANALAPLLVQLAEVQQASANLRALTRLQAMVRNVPPAHRAFAERILRTAANITAARAGTAGRLKEAKSALAIARTVTSADGANELRVNEGALWLASDDPSKAREILSPLTDHVAAAAINAGIAAERLGDSGAALAHWQRAAKLGAADVVEKWIAAKVRLGIVATSPAAVPAAAPGESPAAAPASNGATNPSSADKPMRRNPGGAL